MCIADCLDCSDGSTCNTCDGGKYTTYAYDECVADCTTIVDGSNNYYGDANNHCDLCDPACSSCTGSSAADCDACASGYNKGISGSGYTDTCLVDCVTGEFFDYTEGQMQCTTCIDNCDTCSNANECEICTAGSHSYLLTDLTCGTDCAMNTADNKFYSENLVCYDC